MKTIIAMLALLCAVCTATAADDRSQKIAQIIEAQGLRQMFQQQIDQSKATAADYGRQIYRKLSDEMGGAKSPVNAKMEAAFGR